MKWKTKRERKRHYTWATERIQVFDRMRQENVLNVAQAQLTFTVQGSMTFSLNCAQVLFIYLFFFSRYSIFSLPLETLSRSWLPQSFASLHLDLSPIEGETGEKFQAHCLLSNSYHRRHKFRCC